MKETRWYGDWEKTFPKKVKKHNSRGLKALEFVRDSQVEIEGVVEYFGGTGNHSRQIQEVLKPEWHMVFDLHPEACAALRVLPLPLKVVQEEFSVASARDLYPDLVVLDSHNFTLMKLKEEHVDSLRRIFDRRPAALVANDLAGEYFWMIRKAYAEHLELASLTYEEYVHYLALWFWEEFGYGMPAYWHGAPAGSLRPGPGVFVLRPGEAKPVIHPNIGMQPRGGTL
jgi:hypothetical protein